MSTLSDYHADLATKLAQTGLRVVTEPSAVNPPAVVVAAPTTVTAGPGASCTLTVTTPIYLCVPPPGRGASVAFLLEHLVSVMDAVGGREARAADLVVNDGTAPLPAYVIELVATIPTS